MSTSSIEKAILAVSAAQRLAERTRALLRFSREVVHKTRNARHHAAMLRVLAKLVRSERPR